MTFKDVVLSMWQYWALGGAMIAATVAAGYKDLVRVDKKAITKFAIFLFFVALWRLLTIKYMLKLTHMEEAADGMKIIPWPATLTVFWEDACHGLPLVLMQLTIGMDKLWKKVINYGAMALVMISFGSGHVYQGVFAACLLAFYIPYSIKLGKQYGFGTVMLGHTLYDLSTILVMRAVIGSIL